MTPSGAPRRPRPSFVTGPVTRWLRRISVALTAVGITATVLLYPRLPETVPTHFTLTGEADSWGPRASVLGLLAIWAVLTALLTVLSGFPHLFNYPAAVTEQNAQALYREGQRMMVTVGFAVSVLFCGITALFFGLPGAVLTAAGGIGVLAASVIGIVRCVRAAS